MNNQDIFNLVSTHLLTQKKRSVEMEGSTSCVMHSKNGLKCAIGCLIPESALTPQMQNVSIHDLMLPGIQVPPPYSDGASMLRRVFTSIGIKRDQYGLLVDLQAIHDNSEPNFWYDNLVSLADRLFLSKSQMRLVYRPWLVDGVYNWPMILDRFERGDIDETHFEEINNAAGDWPTCACGNMCSELPKLESTNQPIDPELYHAGIAFSQGVNAIVGYGEERDLEGGLHKAREAMDAIELRSSELLEEIRIRRDIAWEAVGPDAWEGDTWYTAGDKIDAAIRSNDTGLLGSILMDNARKYIEEHGEWKEYLR